VSANQGPIRRSGAGAGGEVAVRLAEPADLGDVVGLLGDCVQEMRARGLDQWDDLYPDRSTLAADIDGRALYLASAGARRAVGAFTMNRHQDPEYADVPWQVTTEPVAVVHRLMVHPPSQRTGLGRFLMRFAEWQAHQLGFRALRLDTLVANARAMALYQELEYRQAGYVRFRKGVFACFEKSLDGAVIPPPARHDPGHG
jgi:GNAT superfamily N-acetyltransferase